MRRALRELAESGAVASELTGLEDADALEGIAAAVGERSRKGRVEQRRRSHHA